MPAVRPAFPGPPPGAELTPCSYVAPEGLEAGWTGQWRVDEPFLKFFALSTPA